LTLRIDIKPNCEVLLGAIKPGEGGFGVVQYYPLKKAVKGALPEFCTLGRQASS
jgi:hypothetical protein